MPARPSIRIGHLSTMYHTAFLLRGSGILADHGIDATWTLLPSGPDIVDAMQAGTIDLGYIGLPPVIVGLDRGLPLTCIAGGHVEGTVVIAGEGVRPLAECKSMSAFFRQISTRAIGTPPRGSIHDVIIREVLEKNGISDVAVKNYPWADFLPDALERGEIAAAAGTPALAVTAERYGKAKVVIPPDRLWPFNPSYGIVVERRMLEQQELLLGFLAAHEEGCELIRQDPRSAARIVAGTIGMVDPGFVMRTYQISPRYCAALPPAYIASTMRFVHTLQRLGYITHPVSETAIFEPSLIRAVHPMRHHYNDGILI